MVLIVVMIKQGRGLASKDAGGKRDWERDGDETCFLWIIFSCSTTTTMMISALAVYPNVICNVPCKRHS